MSLDYRVTVNSLNEKSLFEGGFSCDSAGAPRKIRVRMKLRAEENLEFE
jgi:hypothetical protein